LQSGRRDVLNGERNHARLCPFQPINLLNIKKKARAVRGQEIKWEIPD
jgi:hypothetical protein